MNQIKKESWTHRVGTDVFVILLFMYGFTLFMIIPSINEPLHTFLFIVAVSLMFGFVFLHIWKITITVDSTHLFFKLGVFSTTQKKYKLTDITACNPGTASKRGIGTRWLMSGYKLKYYVITGYDVIELHFRDSNTILHIGTPHAKEISEYIQSFIDER